MFSERQAAQLPRHRRAVAAGELPALRAAADAGERLGPAPQPAPRLERRVRRVPQVRARRRPPAARLAGLRPLGPVLRQGVRGRHQPALLPGARHQRLDGFRLAGRHQDRVRPADRRGARLPGAAARRRGRPVLRGQGDRPEHPAAAQSGAPDGRLRHAGADAAARARRSSSPCSHELAETIRQRALVRHHLRPVRRARAAARLLPAPAVPQARRGGVSPARSARAELRLPPARCGFSTWKAGPSIFAEPNEIADRYHKALGDVSRRAAAGRAGVGRRLSSRVASTRITSRC